MPYVQRDDVGNVKGVFNRPQPGYAEERLADGHPDVVAYRTPKASRDMSALQDGTGAVTRAEMNALKAFLRGE